MFLGQYTDTGPGSTPPPSAAPRRPVCGSLSIQVMNLCDAAPLSGLGGKQTFVCAGRMAGVRRLRPLNPCPDALRF